MLCFICIPHSEAVTLQRDMSVNKGRATKRILSTVSSPLTLTFSHANLWVQFKMFINNYIHLHLEACPHHPSSPDSRNVTKEYMDVSIIWDLIFSTWWLKHLFTYLTLFCLGNPSPHLLYSVLQESTACIQMLLVYGFWIYCHQNLNWMMDLNI